MNLVQTVVVVQPEAHVLRLPCLIAALLEGLTGRGHTDTALHTSLSACIEMDAHDSPVVIKIIEIIVIIWNLATPYIVISNDIVGPYIVGNYDIVLKTTMS
jgi:hypothetical protein